jgi:selenocysteine-specific elongation factor
VLARVRVLEGERLEADRPALVQLRLESPVAAGRGDRLVIRSYSPARTIGGACVLDPAPPRRKSVDAQRAAALRALAEAPLGAAAVSLVREAGVAGLGADELAARVSAPIEDVRTGLHGRSEVVALGPERGRYLASAAAAALAEATRETLRRFHAENPLRAAMPREELRHRVFARAAEGALEHVLDSLARTGEVALQPDAVALAGQGVRLTDEEADTRAALVAAARAAGLTGIEVPQAAGALRRDARLVARVARLLAAEGELQRVGEGLLVHRQALEALKDEVRRRWPPGARLEVAGFKELTGLSRKWVIPLLEYLDRERVTRRAGADRLVLGDTPRAGASR